MSYQGELAACPPGPVPANTWTVWLGPVPSQLTTFAISDLKTEADHPYGYEWLTTYDGQQVMAIKQHHTWTYNGGKLITGICIPGITLYRPKKVGLTEVETDLNSPNQDIAWFDDGNTLPPINTTLVTICGAAIITVIALFFLALRYFKKR
jgi:hypothetical protein